MKLEAIRNSNVYRICSTG